MSASHARKSGEKVINRCSRKYVLQTRISWEFFNQLHAGV